eukprot:m.216190 g.216190  ORF g.216190 m.216190 type:complete len:56 (+) comp39854_c0_seq3:1378-1545(+)
MRNEAIRLHIRSGDPLPTVRVAGQGRYDELVRDCSAFDSLTRPSFNDVVNRLKQL